MKTKFLIPLLLSAILIFPQYAFPDSFADNSNSTSSSTNNVNTTSTLPASAPSTSGTTTATSSNNTPGTSLTSTSMSSQATITNSTASNGYASVTTSSTTLLGTSSSSTTMTSSTSDTSSTASSNSSATKSNTIMSSTNNTSSQNSSSNIAIGTTTNNTNSSTTNATSSLTGSTSSSTTTNTQSSSSSVPTSTTSHVNTSSTAQSSAATTTSSTSNLSSASLLPTVSTASSETITVAPNPVTINQGSQVTFTVVVADTSSLSTTPTGTVSWSDGNAGGKFNPVSCTLSSGSCTVSYIPAVNYRGGITITVSYGGDGIHSIDTTTSTLTVNPLHVTTTTITPNPVTINQGSQVTFTVVVADTSSLSTTPTGTVSWSDGNAGGKFNPVSCTLSSGSCTVSYTSAANSQNSITMSATYDGDSGHSDSSDTSQLSINVLPSSLLFTTDQSYYAYGDVVTLSVGLPGQNLQNIAVGVSDPNGDNIISRTITTDQNGAGILQFKIPNTYQTGIYQDIATALVDGKNYTNSTNFTVIKSHGISIDSVQITNQQGNLVSMLKKGQNGFVKVSISSGEKMPALLTLNLFDANQSSLGTASIKSVINPGQSNMTLSFFIPSDAQVGLTNVYTDAYSDWPSNGGAPLTTEACLATDLQDPSTLSVSYVPTQPHNCISSSSNRNGIISGTTNIQNVAMTNNQAMVTLGVSIQNDSMAFMSPAEAHLLALAYDTGTATNTQNNSVALVSLNLNNMSSADPSSIQTSGNVTKIGPAQFTTIAGPDIQNNPMALKILQEIQDSKRQVANILGNETAAKLNEQLVLQQRQAAANQLKQDLTTLAQENAATTPDAAYADFLTTVGDNRTQAVFQNEYNFMQQRVGAANAAMQTALDNGASLDQALLTFDQYATINHVQMVDLNSELNVAYGLADSRIQSCFNSSGQLVVINGINPCVANIENNSTGPSGMSIVSVQPSDQQGNPVSLLKRGQTGYVKVVLSSNMSTRSLVTVNLFDSNISSLGTASVQYTLNPGQSEVVLPYYVPAQSGTGLASIYANIFTDWPNKGGTSQSNELSYFVGLS